MFEAQPISKIAIKHSEYLKYGCPACQTGEKQGHQLISLPGITLWCCASCSVAYYICDDNVTQENRNLNKAIISEHPKRKDAKNT